MIKITVIRKLLTGLTILSVVSVAGILPNFSLSASSPTSLRFDGNDVATAVNLPLMTRFTLEAWVLRASDRGTYETFISDANGSYSQAMLSLFIDGGSRECQGQPDQFAYYQTAGNYVLCSGITANTNTWYHVAIVRENTGALRFYINGNLTASSTASPVPGNSSGNLSFGRAGSSNTEHFIGLLDDIHLAAAPLYAASFIPSTDPAVTETTYVLYRFNETTGQTLFDSSGFGRNAVRGTTTSSQSSDPAFATEIPFAGITPTPTPSPTPTTVPTPEVTPTPTPPSPTPSPSPSPTSTPSPTPGSGNGFAIRFFGTGRDNLDRVRIPIDNPTVPADIGAGDFTLEFWVKAFAENNTGSAVCNANDGWITGNILLDRDIWGSGDYGDFGVSLTAGGRLAFGVSRGSSGTTLCSQDSVADGSWHHIALTRNATSGMLAIFVDGEPNGQTTGPTGNISYRDGRSTNYPDDPFLVLGAEKHDADQMFGTGSDYPSFNGILDELRISGTVRYAAQFPVLQEPLTADGSTLAHYHFDEGTGTVVSDVLSSSPGTVIAAPGQSAFTMDTPFP